MSQYSNLDSIELDVKSSIVCGNINRVAILHLLKCSEGNEMQAEMMAYRLGLSHRTVLYHLDILHDYELVEVRKFIRRGDKMFRSVWGLNRKNGHTKKIFSKIDGLFEKKELEGLISQNKPHQ